MELTKKFEDTVQSAVDKYLEKHGLMRFIRKTIYQAIYNKKSDKKLTWAVEK